PWIGKQDKTERPMYEAEIALLRGDARARFGESFFEDVERLHHFFGKQEIDPRLFVLSTWELLKNDAKAKKADPREPMERLYDLVLADNPLSSSLSEEQINQRITAWFGGKHLLATV
ncbi:deoxyribonuclease IV, partial [Paenibacillus sp. MCAF20]